MRCLALAFTVAIPCAALAGPDIIPGSITSVTNYGELGGTRAVAAGLAMCNIGDANLTINAITNQHAVITQNLYRVESDGVTQIGMSWVTHTFCALQQSLCGTCTPAQVTCTELGVGCSDVMGGGLAGSQSNLSSRTDVDASVAIFSFPFTPAAGNSLFKRLQYSTDDVNPATHPGARYFVELVTLAPDDAAAGNGANGAAYREVTIRPDGGLGSFLGDTVRELPAIYAWQDIDPTVQISFVDIPGDGRVYVASKASDLGNGSWRYAYTVMNLNSHESVRGISVPSAGGGGSNLAFAGIDYHSGDTVDSTDWAGLSTGTTVSWETATPASDPDANAIRWATGYSFSFESTAAPADGTVELETYRSQTVLNIGAVTPAAGSVCVGDCDMSGAIDFGDLVEMLFHFGLDFVPPECDPTEDAQADFNDLVATLFLFGDCPD